MRRPVQAGALLLIVLQIACGDAGVGPRSPESSATSSSTPAVLSPTPRVVVVTELDDEATVQVPVGALIQVTLSDRFIWSVELTPAGILTAAPGQIAPVKGTQLVARAVAPGTVTLIARGTPACVPSQPCVQFVGIHVTIVVR